MKVIDVNNLKNTKELNFYQKFLKWKFKMETIREFNQDILRATGENRDFIYSMPRDYKFLYDGTTRTVYKIGYEEAMTEIEEMYDFRCEKGNYYFARKKDIDEKDSD